MGNLLAMLLILGLVSGFQIGTQEGTIQSINSSIGIEEAYAGVCSDNGCIGGKDVCLVVKILWGAYTKTCYTTVPEDIIQEE